MSRFELPEYRHRHWLVVGPVALIVGALGGLALGSLLDAAWFGRFMLGPGGGALLTVLGTSAIGYLAYTQGNRRLAYERERDALERAETIRVARYAEEKAVLKRLMTHYTQLDSILDALIEDSEDERALERASEFAQDSHSEEKLTMHSDLLLSIPDQNLAHLVSEVNRAINDAVEKPEPNMDERVASVKDAILNLRAEMTMRMIRLRNSATLTDDGAQS